MKRHPTDHGAGPVFQFRVWLRSKLGAHVERWAPEQSEYGVHRRFILCLLSFAFAVSADALEITYSNVSPFSGSVGKHESILLQGEIIPGDYDRLRQVIRKDQERFWRSTGFVLASPGGDIQEALRIARLVKGTYSGVWVGKQGSCVSACFFIFTAAVQRTAGDGTIGVHRPYVHPARLSSVSVREAEILQRQALKLARAYLEDQDVPTNLIDKMFQQASTDVYWLSRAEVEEQLGRRPPWFDQLLIAKCGLDTSLERRYFTSGDVTLLPGLYLTEECANRLAAEEGRKFLSSELSAYTK